MRPNISGKVVSKQAQQKLNHDKHTAGREHFIGQRVMVRNLRPGDKWVAGTIIERTGPLSYLVQTVGGQIWKCHIDHLRQMDDSPKQEQTTEEESTNKETINIHFPQSQTASSTEPANDELTQTEIEPAVTTHRYPQRVHVPSDRLSYQ